MIIHPLNVNDIFDAVWDKEEGLPCYFYQTGHSLSEQCVDKKSFMIPTYRVKKEEVNAWLEKFKHAPPNPLGTYEAILVTYRDPDGAEPRHGAAIIRITEGTSSVKKD